MVVSTLIGARRDALFMKTSQTARILVTLLCLLLIYSCDNGGQTTAATPTNTPSSSANENKPIAEYVLIQGRVTFDQIPQDPKTGLLRYDAALPSPVRQAHLEAVSLDESILFSTVTDVNGNYSVMVPQNTDLRLRVWAQIEDTQHGMWRAQVIDNTANNATYILESPKLPSGTAPSIVNIHADSGYADGTFDTLRPSAPFAILDTLYRGFSLLDQSVEEPMQPLSVAWSPRNISAIGSISEGQIGSSYYTNQGESPTIFLLGAANSDADDYDKSVILHEFGHYVMDQISRPDTIGGGYTPDAHLDLRVAFNESISNLFSALILETPMYFDTLNYTDHVGNVVQSVQAFDFDAHQVDVGGWYSPEAITWILYDLLDAPTNDDDALKMGWAKLYEALTDPSFLSFDGAVSIYTLLETLRLLNPEDEALILDLARRQNLTLQDAYGSEETNDGGSPVSLPLHHMYDGTPLHLCSTEGEQDYNGLGVRRLIRFEIDTPGEYTIRATRSGGDLAVANPDFLLFKQGRFVLAGVSAPPIQTNVSDEAQNINRETLTHPLEAGVYIMDLFERKNADNTEQNGGEMCFDVTINPGGQTNAIPSRACDNLASLLGDSHCFFAEPSTHDSMAF